MTLPTFEMWSGLTGLLLDQGKPGEIYNVCSGSATSLADIIQMFQSISTTKVTIEVEAARVRRDDVPHICGDREEDSRTDGLVPEDFSARNGGFINRLLAIEDCFASGQPRRK